MSVAAFAVDSVNPLLAQPSTEAIVARSTAADTSQTLTIHGTTVAAGGYDSEGLTLTGTLEIEFTNSAADDWNSLTSASLSATCTGVVSLYSQGSAATGSIYVDAQPSNNDTLTIGLGATTQVYTFKTVLTGAANEVFIGADTDATATNIKKAINDEGTENTHYGTGTAINAFVSAAVTGSVITLTDKLAVARLRSWVLTPSNGGSLNCVAPTGGVLGTLLASIAIGDTAAYDDISLLNEDLAGANLPAGVNFTSDWINLGGASATLNLSVSGTALAVSYQTSTDGSTARTGQTTLPNGSGGTAGSATFYSQNLGESAIQYIRFLINNNSSTSRVVHAIVTY